MRRLGSYLSLIFLFALMLSACGGPEQAAVDQFFRAAQTNDHATLAAMAAVGPPGEVEAWEAVEVSSRTTEPYVLPELVEKFEASEKKRDTAAEERKKYFEDHRDALDQIIPKLRDDPDYTFRGSVGEVQKEWARLQDERQEIESVYQELKRSLERERRIASRSVVRQIDIGGFEGDVSVSKVLYNLKAPEGEPLPFDVTLRRYNVAEPGSDRTEPARWVIVDIEGATPEARAAAEAARERGAPTKTADASESTEASEAPSAAQAAAHANEPVYLPKELRGEARVQIMAPETKVVGENAVTTVRVRNASKDWVTRFTVTEYWYDEQGNSVSNSSRTHEGRFMPGDVIELELRTHKQANFFQNQFEFSHANGDVKATVVGHFPAQAATE